MMLTRRGFLGSILALAAAPAIVRADSLMRVVPRDTAIFIGPSIPEMVAAGHAEPMLPPGYAFRWDPFARMFSVIDRTRSDAPLSPEIKAQLDRALAAHNAAHLSDQLLREPVRNRKPTTPAEQRAMRTNAGARRVVRYAADELVVPGTEVWRKLSDLA